MEASESRTPVELLRETWHYASQAQSIAKVHVTIDFYLHLQADKQYGSVAPIYDMRQIEKEEALPLFGLPVVVHFELCEKAFWFESEDVK